MKEVDYLFWLVYPVLNSLCNCISAAVGTSVVAGQFLGRSNLGINSAEVRQPYGERVDVEPLREAIMVCICHIEANYS